MNTTAPTPLLAVEPFDTSTASRWGRMYRLVKCLTGFLLLLTRALWDYFRRVWQAGRHGDLAIQSAWLSRWSQATLELLGIRLRTAGQPASGSGILVANHLSYLDVVVLAALHPCVFVAKSEVRSWPVLGFMARLAGTLFIDRESRLDVARLNAQLTHCVQQGTLVVIFPEGTSTDGHKVLPFHCALLEPAGSNGWSVAPAWLGYILPGGSAEREVCYWGRMTFLPHCLNLLSRRDIVARVHFGEAITCPHRKSLGRRLREAVLALAPTEINLQRPLAEMSVAGISRARRETATHSS